MDAEYDYDGGLEMYESKKKHGNSEQLAKRDRDRQVAAFKRQEASTAGCTYCFKSEWHCRQGGES